MLFRYFKNSGAGGEGKEFQDRAFAQAAGEAARLQEGRAIGTESCWNKIADMDQREASQASLAGSLKSLFLEALESP